MSEMAVFRSEVECLRAENERLTARVAELEAKPVVEKVPMRFVVEWSGRRGEWAAVSGVVVLICVGFYIAWAAPAFVATGHVPMTDPTEQRLAIVFAIAAIAWCLAFVRRVPR